MKYYNKNLLILSIALLLTACSSYQRHFGGKSGDYAKASTTNALKYSSCKTSLLVSDHYNVPDVTATEQTVAITPPDYQD
jgi:uncharacterized lipoprotein